MSDACPDGSRNANAALILAVSPQRLHRAFHGNLLNRLDEFETRHGFKFKITGRRGLYLGLTDPSTSTSA